jgi:hypothetical protein
MGTILVTLTVYYLENILCMHARKNIQVSKWYFIRINKLCFTHKWNTKQQWKNNYSYTHEMVDFPNVKWKTQATETYCVIHLYKVQNQEKPNNILCQDTWMCGKTIQKVKRMTNKCRVFKP